MDERLLTILQTARQFNLPSGLLYAAVAHGELAAIRFRPRGRIRLRQTDVRGWIEGHACDARPEADASTLRRTHPPSTPSELDQLLPPKALRRFA